MPQNAAPNLQDRPCLEANDLEVSWSRRFRRKPDKPDSLARLLQLEPLV